ncbi:MAG: hypothetical protein ACRET5_18170 [Steroidobacteraceae bacterium]
MSETLRGRSTPEAMTPASLLLGAKNSSIDDAVREGRDCSCCVEAGLLATP